MKSRSHTYEECVAGLGKRYHAAMLHAVSKACEAPSRFKVARSPNLRKVPWRGFPFALIYREHAGEVQILAVAHYRRKPGYWTQRD